MNEQANEIVERVIRALDQTQIPHMLVGSLSSNSYGIERSTQDADFVIELGNQSVMKVASLLAPNIQIDPQIGSESVTLVSRYQGKHVQTGFGIEFFLLSNDAFHQARFQRRQKYRFGNVDAYLPTPEDVVVQKLRWYIRAKRSKDFDDAKNVVAVQWNQLDLAYIRQWTDQHGSRTVFEQLLQDVGDQ